MILIVAVVAVASATAGPTYYAASQTSILHDSVASTNVIGRGYEVVEPDGVGVAQTSAEAASDLGRESRLFYPEVQAMEATALEPHSQAGISIVWRSDVCAHLRIEGACPQATGQVIISRSLASVNEWHLGDHVTFLGWGALTVTGIYEPPASGDDYWFDRTSTYFPYENPASTAGERGSLATLDAMFTSRATLSAAPGSTQVTTVISAVLDDPRVRPGDASMLAHRVTNLVNDQQINALNAVATSEIPATMATVKLAWSALSVPVLIVTIQMLGLAWLLLFLLVTEAAAARGPEIALAKLRGYGGWRVVSFGLSEPALLLALALPVGAMAGWGVATLLGHDLLRPGTHIGLPALGWAAAGTATAGGVIAVVLASQRTFRRPVVDQWRRASPRAHDRSWVIDAILLTGAAAGLIELTAGGLITSGHHNALSLLVPGLLGLAVAVVASRLLPLVVNRTLGRGSRVGGLAAFLAVRHVARRPGASRTTIMLATSFALATFAFSAWSVSQTNYRRVAEAQVGAPTVLSVTTPAGKGLDAEVGQGRPRR